MAVKLKHKHGHVSFAEPVHYCYLFYSIKSHWICYEKLAFFLVYDFCMLFLCRTSVTNTGQIRGVGLMGMWGWPLRTSLSWWTTPFESSVYNMYVQASHELKIYNSLFTEIIIIFYLTTFRNEVKLCLPFCVCAASQRGR